jgi:spore maturation protein CgeB
MRILSVVRRGYYGNSHAIEPLALYFTVPLQALGHLVETFDHYAIAAQVGSLRCTERLVETIRNGAFDLVLYQTAGSEPIDTEQLAALSRRYCIVAWNSDDDWQWEGGTSKVALHFSFMVTTYRQIYCRNRREYPNLILNQWGCLQQYAMPKMPKDIRFSFAGTIYSSRARSCRYLAKQAGLRCFGRGARLIDLRIPHFRGVFKLPLVSGRALPYEQVHAIWNRTQVSFTPMAGGPAGDLMSIKSRTFDMGMSGTLMLCEHSPGLEEFYEPGKECVIFSSVQDCAEKAAFYLRREQERERIAHNYVTRTCREHTWEHRFRSLFRQVGL